MSGIFAAGAGKLSALQAGGSQTFDPQKAIDRITSKIQSQLEESGASQETTEAVVTDITTQLNDLFSSSEGRPNFKEVREVVSGVLEENGLDPTQFGPSAGGAPSFGGVGQKPGGSFGNLFELLNQGEEEGTESGDDSDDEQTVIDVYA